MALDDKIEAMQRLTITQADHEAEEKEMEDLRRAVETKDEVSLNLKVSMCCCADRLFCSFPCGNCVKSRKIYHPNRMYVCVVSLSLRKIEP